MLIVLPSQMDFNKNAKWHMSAMDNVLLNEWRKPAECNATLQQACDRGGLGWIFLKVNIDTYACTCICFLFMQSNEHGNLHISYENIDVS